MEQLTASRRRELSDPVAATHERREPFEVDRLAHASRRGEGARRLFDEADALSEVVDEPSAACLDSERLGDCHYVAHHVVERDRLDGHNLGGCWQACACSLHVILSDGADAALLLREDDCRCEKTRFEHERSALSVRALKQCALKQ